MDIDLTDVLKHQCGFHSYVNGVCGEVGHGAQLWDQIDVRRPRNHAGRKTKARLLCNLISGM